MKEYSLQELLNFPIGTEFEEIENKDILTIVNDGDTIYIELKKRGTILKFSSYWLSKKYIKVPQSVSFVDVINSDIRCKIDYYRINELIEDDESDFEWLKGYQNLDDIMYTLSKEFNTTAFKEILRNAKWYLESEVDEQ